MWRLILLLPFLCIGCGSIPPKQPASVPKQGGGYFEDDGPGEHPPPNLEATPDAVPRLEPLHKYANLPYLARGNLYIPETQPKPYKARGMASWYGRKFNGRSTATGEPYDMYAMTGAHATLPVPSYARVTNLRNSKSVIVRINDRGPFHGDRLIDLSYTAALKLGYANEGSALVEVERIFPHEGSMNARTATTGAAPAPSAADNAQPAPSIYVQLGAFRGAIEAASFRNTVADQLAWLREMIEILARDGLFHVRLGPYASANEAGEVADRIHRALKLYPFLSRE